MAEKKFKYDIFDILKRLSKKQRDFTDDEFKAMVPLVITRWLSGTNIERQIEGVNAISNRYCFSLSNHKELQIKLLTIATPGRLIGYKWIKREAKSKKTKLAINVVAKYYRYSLRTATAATSMLNDETIIQHAEDLGYQKDQLRDLKKELKLR